MPYTYFARYLPVLYCIKLNIIFFKYLNFEKLLYYQNKIKLLNFGFRL